MSTPITALAPKNAGSAALAAGVQLSAVPVTLYGLTVNNTNAAAQFIQLHDSASVPAEGAAPALVIKAPAADDQVIDLGVYGMAFTNGLYVCNSSTAATKTIGAADCQFFARLTVV